MSNSVCVIGAGRHCTDKVLPAIIETGIDIVAVCTRSMNSAVSAIDRFDLRATPYDNIDDMLLAQSCANVVVVVQPEHASAIVEQCIAYGKNVFVEKPLGNNTIEAQHISQLSQHSSTGVMVAFMKRHAPTYMQLLDIINSRQLGDVTHYQLSLYVDSSAWCHSHQQFVYCVAVHLLDLARYLFGEVVSMTSSLTANNGAEQYVVELTMNSGASGRVVLVNSNEYPQDYEHVSVTLQQGAVVIDDLLSLAIQTCDNTTITPWQQLCTGACNYTLSEHNDKTDYLYRHGFVGEMAYYMQCCNNSFASASNATDNVSTMLLCQQMLLDIQR